MSEGGYSIGVRIWILVAIVLGAFAVPASLFQPAAAQPVYPSVTVRIVRIQEIDPIDGLGGDWDWYYWIGDLEGSWTWTRYEAPNGQDVLVGNTHTLESRSSTKMFDITLCEGDVFTNDDMADISSDSGGGGDDLANNCTISTLLLGSYLGTWDLVSNTLSGDMVVADPQGFRTSGDFDGSTGVDQNDANLWFTVSDNYEPPFADAGVDRTGFSGDTFAFDGRSSTATGSSIELYEWDFTGDGATDMTGSVVSWTFSTKGSHTVTLTVTDSIGVKDSDTATVTIQNRAPVAAFAFSPSSPTVRDNITFADTSTDSDGTIASWLWDFGDGATSTLPSPTHRFTTNGPKSVSLTVTDNDGASSTATRTVTIANIDPVAGFTFGPPSPNTDDVVRFTDTSTDEDGTIASRSWDFGDGSTSNLQNPTHNYAAPGSYEVTLTVTDDDGGSRSTTRTVTVAAAPPGGTIGGVPTIAILAIILVAIILGALAVVLRRRRKVPPSGPIPPGPPPAAPPGS